VSDLSETAAVLVVDDQPANIRLLEAILVPRGYEVRTASSGEEALKILAEQDLDLVLLDIVMPGMDGYEVCRRIRERPETAFLPVVMVTASGDEQKVKALESGADDFLTKPINQSELLARVASLARIKRYQDTIKRQADELATWNRELKSRVDQQVSQLERMGLLRRFLSPQIAELIVDTGDESFLESHRREIVVVFCDLRGFTRFAEVSEPEEVIGVLSEYHRCDLPLRGHLGAIRGRRSDGLLQRPDPLRGRAPQGRADEHYYAEPGAGACRTVVQARARSGDGRRHLPGLRDVGQDWLRWPLRLCRDWQCHQPRGSPLRRRGTLADSGD
jgi:CheY-like chemotaxis protein